MQWLIDHSVQFQKLLKTRAGVVAITVSPIVDVRQPLLNWKKILPARLIMIYFRPKMMKRMIGYDCMKGKNVFEGLARPVEYCVGVDC